MLAPCAAIMVAYPAMVHKHFECPHCAGLVPASLDELHAASAAPICQGCGRVVYLTAGKLSNYQPGHRPGEVPTGEAATYDPGE
jgi:hypothetical protein